MGFRTRLILFFVAALVAMQGLTAVLVYQVTRHELIQEGQRQLDVAAKAFGNQLEDISHRVASSVQVLALDFALRSAIAQRDESTLVSALRNHGRRVGATQMLLVDVDGRIEADTRGTLPPGSLFPYGDLMDRALEQPAAAVVAMQDRAYWMVVVPVFAPNLVGFIAAAIPVDDTLLERLQQQSSLPKSIELATANRAGHWTVIARGSDSVALIQSLNAHDRALPARPAVVSVGDREYVAQAVWLNRSKQSAPVAAVLGYSVDEALSPYRSVAAAWGVLSLLGLCVGLLGAWLIARGVSRPVEALATAARQIQAGVYDAHDLQGADAPKPRNDELGQLASAFANMADSIREREARILHQAAHDLVTGLPNRVAAEAAIQHALATPSALPAALLMIGLGNVPEIIKTLGHVVCDRVMRDAAARVGPSVGDGMLARASDTQFSILLPNTNRAAAIAAAFRVLEALSRPYREADLTLDLAPAAGIALAPLHVRAAAPAHGTDAGQADTLLRCAEVALLGALGNDEPVVVYDPTTDPHRPERLSLMGDLRAAIEHGRIDLQFQPKLHLASGMIDGAEGLARWRHPTRGSVSPETFIALAEESGNIRRLTRWALAAGIAQAARWQEQGTPMRVALNVSARDLSDATLPRHVADLMALHSLPPQRLALEITESAIMSRPDAAITILRQLADLGVDLAIDDFGVGQSSFAYLRRLPVRELKIDRTFVTHLGKVREDQVIVRSIIELGHQLGYRVTAEGVEDVAALTCLTDLGCDHAQGFVIGAALRPPEFDALVAIRNLADDSAHAAPVDY